MEIGVLTKVITDALVPFLPVLLKPGGEAEKIAREAGETWNRAKEVWAKLRPKVEAKPAALEVVQELATEPDDADVQAAFRLQLKKLLTQDEALAETLSSLIEKSRTSGVNVTSSGDRSVAIGGNVIGSAIITGDGNVTR